MKTFIKKYIHLLPIFSLTFLSVFSFYYFFYRGQHLLYGDSLSRLNISRKIVDNLTPGLAQLGNVWLPLPQVLMLLFTWNSYLWHSGMAGSVVSMASYIIGGIYLYRSAKILSQSLAASFFALSIYALNINLLYLQTTAMSEPIFLCAIIMTMYYFIQWIHSEGKMHYLMLAAICVSAATLIRYEALALLFSSIPMVFYYSIKKKNNYSKAEGNTIMYTLLACLGFAIWTLYLAVIFGDPLYWKNYYAGASVVQNGSSQIKTYVFHLNVFQAFWKYFTAVVWMSGLIPTVLAVIAFPIMIISSIKRKSYYYIPFLIYSSIYLFMILTLQRNTPIDQPILSWASIISSKTYAFPEFNIRYGLIMLPFISLITVYLFKYSSLISYFVYLLLFVQIYSYFNPIYTPIYQLSINISNNTTQGTERDKALVNWLKQNYDNGLIMISALKHDPQMLQLGVDYKTYIHEGTGKYWKVSTKKPQTYATWIVFDSRNTEDQVTKYLKKSSALNKYYNLLYDNDGIKIFKIKTKPDIII